jgi:hypothetical protein
MNHALSAANTTAFSAPDVIPFGRAPTRLVVVEPRGGLWAAVRDRLEELINLPKGWDGYGAQPVSFRNATFALRMLEAVCSSDTPAPQIVPGTSGDLQIEWHFLSGTVELHVRNPNDVVAWYVDQQNGPDGLEFHLTTNFLAVANWLEALEAAGAAAAAA